MERLVRTVECKLDGRIVRIDYYEVELSPDRRQFVAAIQLGEADELRLDGRTLPQLERLVELTLPAAGLSRALLRRAS